VRGCAVYLPARPHENERLSTAAIVEALLPRCRSRRHRSGVAGSADV